MITTNVLDAVVVHNITRQKGRVRAVAFHDRLGAAGTFVFLVQTQQHEFKTWDVGDVDLVEEPAPDQVLRPAPYH
jgi:hypothetical protein